MMINFVTIHVADIERSIDFYHRVLGMQVSRRFSPRPGMEIAFMGGGGTQLEFIHDDMTPAYKGRGLSLGFYVADMEQTMALLNQNQVEIVSGPLVMKNGVKLLSARDINGVDLGFVQQPK
ncbi:MAG: VOC family protein [Acidobacteria bacterium]|jgi:lactoylglutathione lyase|nr:VOC family protein [Acidobacteriota bacterium]